MEINIEEIGPCKRKVSVVISADQVDEALNKTYRETAQSVAFPGFRKGKAPKKLVIKRFGEIINQDVKEKLVQEAFSKAIEEHDLEPLSEPELDLADLEMKEGAPFEIVFDVETRPAFDLGEYKNIEVEIEPVTVADADIDQGVKELQSRFASLQSVPDKAVDKKHYLTLDLTYRVEGEEEFTREQRSANMGLGILDGIELKEEMEQFVDKKIDDVVKLDIPKLPEHFTPESLRGKPAQVEARIKDIRAITIPEVDDDFLKKIGMESVDELRQKMHEEVQKGKESKQLEEIDRKIVDQLIAAHSFEIPEKLLMQQITSQEQNMRAEMIRVGIPPDQIAEQASKLEETNREAAERNLRSNFILDKICKKENIYVTDNEIDQELAVIAKQQNARAEEVRSYYESNNLIGGLRSYLRNQKIRKMLRESAKSVEKSGSDAPAEDKAESGDESGETSA